MDNLNRYIEHTLLKQNATKADFIKLFKEAKEYNFWGVCVNPEYVEFAKEYLLDTDVKIITVVGFPLGANKFETKIFETTAAIKDGADEIDMVMNVTALKNKDYEHIVEEISSVKLSCQGRPLKVIIETDLLEKDEIKKACELCIEGEADFVKTSTGFVKNGVGAKVEDVKLIYETVAPHGLLVKASGGIKDRKTAEELIKAGAYRLGTSSGVQIMNG